MIIKDGSGNTVATGSAITITVPSGTTGLALNTGTLTTVTGTSSVELTSGNTYTITVTTGAGGSFVSPSFTTTNT